MWIRLVATVTVWLECCQWRDALMPRKMYSNSVRKLTSYSEDSPARTVVIPSYAVLWRIVGSVDQVVLVAIVQMLLMCLVLLLLCTCQCADVGLLLLCNCQCAIVGWLLLCTSQWADFGGCIYYFCCVMYSMNVLTNSDAVSLYKGGEDWRKDLCIRTL